ncbi:uncharacterized protein LOC113863396 [Abrus precatorius]|uniref:Uncharacterized protein LOC113863396 n=1 Tax=Abrus precatorius TaxID=3816 RepID=A0A8B8LBW4_ABRPR|nr:uncharacterized protein LOC113863396 [Abrus precatorius]
MEALTLHHHRHPLYPSYHYYCSSLTPSTSYSLFRSPPQSSPLSTSSIVASSSDPSLQHSDPKSHQSFNPLSKVSSFLTITAASAFLFLGFCQNRYVNKPIITSSPSSVLSIQEALDEKMELKDCHIQSILHLKLEEKVPIVHSFKRAKTADEEAWQVLKAEVYSSSEGFEFVKIGFEEILEKERKAYHDCVLEHLEMVDECKCLLKGIKVAMDRCERENASVKHSLRFFTKVVAHIRVLEGDMLSALKYYKELDKD